MRQRPPLPRQHRSRQLMYFGTTRHVNQKIEKMYDTLRIHCGEAVFFIVFDHANAGNLNFLTLFWGKALVNELWPLLYKRAELDLRLVN